ncbi:helix-turn-helix transcriptional regulator [Micromonospora endolithica]|uniref:AraC family transcriptional regulator n=1 Tax=Micromonospora endolithica TaxID=230091 RepID=A0A3A9ZJU7_9ACTN|nr:AraC family transcriptional regulator [Micromonospora endolithica]RKN48573.1 AraC family transcriptional regulator [Micromonospora endolithica]TWJ22101.1 AraC-like DNA-binding protein [Micromonospora endolithica]
MFDPLSASAPPVGAPTVWEARGLDAAERALRACYGPITLSGGSGGDGVLRLLRARLGLAYLDHASFEMDVDARGGPLGSLAVGQVTSGRITYRSAGGHRHYRAGQVFLAATAEQEYDVVIRRIDAHLAVLAPAVVAQAASGPARRPVRFLGPDPVSPAAARTWVNTYAYVRDGVLAVPDVADHPLLVGNAARLLAAAALATFPNDALTEATGVDRHDAGVATVRRVAAFVDSHPDLDISVADMAAAARVSIRAVQLAFRRHLGTTPTAYLRRARLHQAHRQLLAADPRTTTVGQVAARWGFVNHSRFTAQYRVEFGVPPSRTLRR